jgi:pimeloyl-ACP methyl ester carboxylesterase
VPESVPIEMHALLAGSQLHWIERAGHVVWLEQPQEFFTAVSAFLAALPASVH